jgi:hypothetical protein
VEAEGLVREFEQSGMTRKAFCAARGITPQTLDRYRRKQEQRVSPRLAQLLPVELLAAQEPAGALSAQVSTLRVELSNGRRIVVEAGFDGVLLKRVVAVLEA